MQTAGINPEGIHFAYVDSGPVLGDTYTTIICIHGYQYSASSFARLLPRASEHNLRIIAFNRRDYAGSSLFSSEELAVIDNHGRDQDFNSRRDEEFFRKRGFEVAEFLVWIIDELKIPKASLDGKSGGLFVLGWSLGTATALAFFAHLSSYLAATQEKIEDYLRTLVLYDPPLSILGYPLPDEGAYHPYNDPEIPKSELPLALARFITGYYTHPYYALGDGKPTEKRYSMLQVKPAPPSEAKRPATSDGPTGAGILATIDDAPCMRSEKAYLRAEPFVLRSLLSRSLLLKPSTSDEIGGPFSNVNIRILHGTDTLWGIVWGIWELEKELERWSREGKKKRGISFTKMDGANHFIHWDEAERFLGILACGS